MIYWIVGLSAFMGGIFVTVCLCTFLLFVAKSGEEERKEDFDKKHRVLMEAWYEANEAAGLRNENLTDIAASLNRIAWPAPPNGVNIDENISFVSDDSTAGKP